MRMHNIARGKAIYLPRHLSVIVIDSTEIARSCQWVLGICDHNQSVDIGEKLVYTRFELLKRLACSRIRAFSVSMPVVY